MKEYIVQGMEYSDYYNGWRSFRISVKACNINEVRKKSIKYLYSVDI